MTIASQISRLQTDKEAMRQAIIGKGVDVAASVSFDDYAACIAQISSGPKTGYVDLLVVGGGGAGGAIRRNAACWGGGGGGGAGGYIYCEAFPLNEGCSYYTVAVGCGGQASLCGNDNGNGGNSCFGAIEAKGGTQGYGWLNCTYTGGSGGGGGVFANSESKPGYCGTAGQGHNGGNGCRYPATSGYHYGGGGGGGASEVGGDGGCDIGGNGGNGCQNSISGEAVYYSSGGGGAACSTNTTPTGGCGGTGGGNGGSNNSDPTSPTTYGSGGGGGRGNCSGYTTGCLGTNGCQGVVILRYKTDGTCGISPSSTGGCKYTCGERTIHCFCNAGALETFNPVYN